MEHNEKAIKELQVDKQAHSHLFYLFLNIQKALLLKKNSVLTRNKKIAFLLFKQAYFYFWKF